MNTLFKKGYLWAGVIMAANIFVGNEMMASTTFNDPKSGQPIPEPNSDQKNDLDATQELKNPGEHPAPQSEKIFGSLLRGLLSWEGRINFFGGLFFSAANNYLKWWDYNPGGYWNLRIGCLGLRSKRFLNGILQFEGNFNLGRGAFWLIMTCLGSFKYFRGEISQQKLTSTAAVIMSSWGLDINKGLVTYCLFFFLLSFQGFVSIPLTLHLPKINLSISISLDSLIWGITGMILEKKVILNSPNTEEDILANKVNKVNDNKDDNELKEQTDETDNENK